MGPRASSAWRGARRLCGMYKFTTKPFFGWDVNKTEVPCWEVVTLFARYRTQCNSSLWALCLWWVVIGYLLHRLNYPSLPITFPCFNSRGVYIFKCSRPEYSWKIARWTLNTNQSINQSMYSRLFVNQDYHDPNAMGYVTNNFIGQLHWQVRVNFTLYHVWNCVRILIWSDAH